MKGLENDFEDNGKLTSNELKKLHELSKNLDKLEGVNQKLLKDLKKSLEGEKKGYLDRNTNSVSKKWVS